MMTPAESSRRDFRPGDAFTKNVIQVEVVGKNARSCPIQPRLQSPSIMLPIHDCCDVPIPFAVLASFRDRKPSKLRLCSLAARRRRSDTACGHLIPFAYVGVVVSCN